MAPFVERHYVLTINGVFVRKTNVGQQLKSSEKPFEISKPEVWEVYERVKVNKGASGVGLSHRVRVGPSASGG
jgi:hypothetical protein